MCVVRRRVDRVCVVRWTVDQSIQEHSPEAGSELLQLFFGDSNGVPDEQTQRLVVTVSPLQPLLTTSIPLLPPLSPLNPFSHYFSSLPVPSTSLHPFPPPPPPPSLSQLPPSSPCLYLLLQIMLHSHHHLAQLVPLLCQTHCRVLCVPEKQIHISIPPSIPPSISQHTSQYITVYLPVYHSIPPSMSQYTTVYHSIPQHSSHTV